MAKFMVLYSSTLSAKELMANATPEQMKTSMDAWIKWRAEASPAFTVEFGLPLQAVGRITADGAADSDSKISGYSIMEGDSKEALLEILQTHPQMQRPNASLDVFEMLPMPGIEQ